MDTFPIVKRKDEEKLGEYRTLTIGGHRVGRYCAQGKLLTPITK
jgi:hypothetical protein